MNIFLRTRHIGALICGSLFLLSCGDGSPTTNPRESTILFQIKEQSFSKQAGKCLSPEDACMVIEVQYPVLSGGNQPLAAEFNIRLEEYLKKVMREFITEDELDNYESLAELAEAVVDEYRKVQDENPGYETPWSMDIEAAILFQNDLVITIESVSETYTGGAHGNSYVELGSFSMSDGSKLLPEDYIKDLDGFLEIAEMKFRDVRGLADGAAFDELGFLFDNNVFTLPDEMGIVDDGILLYYNKYEVASYAAGPTSVVVPYEELSGLIDPALFP